MNSDEDILCALQRQNAHILGGVPEGEYRTVVRYRRRARNPLECHVVLQVSPPVWQSLTKTGKVHIDLQRVQVEDQSPLIQCTKCLAYGHGRKLCTEAVDQCSHCTGLHLRKDCPHWMAGDAATCCNCKGAKLDQGNHNAFSKDCPIRQNWDKLARSSVAYC
ncbi:jg22557 [Pararge aegeria aegeria]|uniref:Jg22557 protein n=1 Tax=Pararge aegeria aegeria TaxID=348720 RepID=A0A8S4QPZ3_9NEOP|nr:jg22557 [Pararge aegeria aegeria]